MVQKLLPFIILAVLAIAMSSNGGSSGPAPAPAANVCPAGSYNNGGSCVYP